MKKSVVTIPLLLIACALTIFFGTRYAASQREEMSEEQSSPSENGTINDGEEPESESESADVPVETASALEEYEGRLETLSHYERMDYLSMINEGVSIAFFGDIDLAEEWVESITTTIENHTTYNAELLDFTHTDLDSYELYIQQTAQPLVNESPDYIFYGMPALPDKIRDIGLAETETYMSSVLNSLSTLDDAELVIIEPYPIVQEIDQLNSRSLDYRSYLNRMRQLVENNQLSTITLHSTFTERAQEEGLQSYYNESDYSLTSEGHQLAAEIVDSQLSETRE
ncbi:MAG: hypothetical protein JJU16_02500 [Alkalibacterium sp.]|nr:hypothetical protein [Alkalibacterium sp.]